MKFFGLARATLVGMGLLAAGFSVGAQTKIAQATTGKPAVSQAVAPIAATVSPTPTTPGATYQTVVTQTFSSANGTRVTKKIVRHKIAPAATRKTAVAAKTFKAHPNVIGPPTVVNSVNFGSAEVGGTPVTMTLTYPAPTSGATIAAAVSTTVPNGGVAPGSPSDYIFFGNANVEFGDPGGGQPTNLTNFTVSTLSNVEYPGNGNYTSVIAPGGTTAFTTGSVTDNPPNYPNTTPHTSLLATFSPLSAGSFTVYILDGNTDGVVVGNSSVGLGVNGGAEVVTTSHFLSGVNEFTQFNVTNASPSDVFQVYATTSVNNYPSIGGLTFVQEAPNPQTSTLTAAATANIDFAVTASSCNSSVCTATVTFTPGHPGLGYDAISLIDSNGKLVYETFVSGLGMAPQFGYDLGQEFDYGGYFPNPTAIAIGPDEHIYFTSAGSNSIYEEDNSISNENTITLNGLSTPSGIAVDGSNTLYVADQTNNDIITYTAAGVQGTVATTPLSGPSQIVVDGTGALYIADTGNGRVIKIDNQGNETTIASGLTSPTAVTVDSVGDVFYADAANNGEIFELAVGTTTPTTYQSQLNQVPNILTTDPSGAVYLITDQGLNIFAAGSQNQYTANGTDTFAGLAVDRNGAVYLTQPGDNKFIADYRNDSNFILSAPPGTLTQGNISITNTGNETLTLSNFSVTGTEFTIDSSSQCVAGYTLSAAQTCGVTIDFVPPGAMNYTETFTATSDSLHMPGTTDIFTLYGNGIGDPSTTTLSASPNPVASGNPVTLYITVLDSSADFTPMGSVTIMDGGNAIGSADLSAGKVAGTSTTQFTIPSLSIGSHDLTVSFPGDANVSPSTSNDVTVNATDGPPPPNGGIAVTSQNFGSVAVGQTISMNVVFAGGSNPSFNVNNGEDFKITGFSCDSSCVVAVSFTPIFPGARTDTITELDTNGNIVAKTYVYGTATGPLFGFNPGNSAVDSTWQAPNGIAVSQAGVAFLSDTATDKVYELASGAGALPIVNLGTPGSVAIDSGGMIYVVDQTKNLIVTYNQPTSTQGTVTTADALSNPGEIAVDGAGSLYIADTGNNRIIKIDNQGNETTLASGLSSPTGVAVDAAGDVYYADSGSAGEIVELPITGGQPVHVGTSLSTVFNLSLDASGSVYFTGAFSGIRIISPSLQNFGFTGQLTGNLTGIALGPNGDIYTTQQSTGHEEQLSRASINFFSSTPVGVSVQHGGPQVMNTGNTPLTIGNLSLASGTVFTIDSGSICQNGLALSPGGLCNTLVDFLPPAAQSYNDTLTFTSNSDNVAGSTNMDSEAGVGVGSTGTQTSITTLTASSSSIAFGQTETLTATVSGSGPNPTGTVTFFDGSTAIGVGPVGGRTATLAVSNLAVGTHSITAVYNGDTNYASSTSSAVPVTVTSGTGGGGVNSQNFGNVAVGQSASINITYAVGSNPTITAVNNIDFTVSTVNCSSSCVATVTFTPQYPGLREDVVTVSSGSTLLAKTYVYGVGTGPQFGFDYSSDLQQSDIQQPTGIAVDPNGYRYISDPATKQIYKVTSTSNGNAFALPISNLGNPIGVAIDGGLKLYIADQSNNRIVTYDENANVQGTVTTSALSSPTGIAVDGAGSLYITDTGNNRIIKLDNLGNETTLATNVSSLGPIAVDSAGDVYYAVTTSPGTITELPAGGGPAVTVASNVNAVNGLAADASGRVYYTTTNGVAILPPPSCVNCPTEPIEIAGLFPGQAYGVALGADGDLFVTAPSVSQYRDLTRTAQNGVTSANVGSSSLTPLVISNTGNGPLTISNFSFTGTTFTIDPSSTCAPGTVLAAGTTCDAVIKFQPAAVQTYNDNLTFTSNSLNATGSTNVFMASGNGLGPSTTTLVLSPNPVTVGQTETLTATVTYTSQPTGTVNFLDGTTVIGSGTLSGSGGTGTAQFTISTLAVGSHSITASYLGDGNAPASVSAAQTLVVTAASTSPTTTTLSVSSPSIVAGQTETLTANITGGPTPALTGTVTFYDGTTSLGSPSVSSTSTGATATLSVSTLSVGSHQITAVYSGDTNYLGGSSEASTVTVTPAQTGATTTTLTAAPATVAYEKPITLTASVQTSNGVPVSVGQVIFCDANVAHCNPVMNLATAQLTSSGVAVVKLSAGTIGSHSYKAIFLGTTASTTSTSSTQAVTVTGTYPSFTMITSTGSVGAYDLTATVAGVGSGILSPTGTVSFNDTSNSNTPLLGTARLGSATLSYSAVQPAGSPVAVGNSPYGAATGDFNGDGFVDLVVENYNSNTVSVLLGNGDGTFQPQVTYAVGTLPERVLVADFNGDGILDLVVANTGSNNISILLGNGDGTFQPQVTYPVSSPVGLGVMDLNHDGIADIVASDYYSNTVSVLLGNGDGTFKAAVTYPTGNTPQTLAEGDFNGDGNVDLAVGNLNDNTVGIYLGNGDGTFKAAVTYSVGSQPQGVQVGDFNGDGFADLAVSNSGDGTVSVLLGKGDGTFQAQVPYAVGGSPVGLAIADFNGDGNQDISVDNAAQSSLSQSVLLGKGNGTFQTQLTFKTGNFPYGLAVGDFNGDGYPDMAISNDVDGTSTILLSQVTQTATATITGVALSGAVGTHNIDASYPGDTNFGMSVSATLPLTSGSAGAPTLASISPASGSVGSSAVTVTLTGTNFSASDVVQLNGTAVVSAFVNATTLTTVIPASFLATAGTGQIAVFDPVSGATTVALPFVVTATPQIVFSGPTTAAPDQQPALTLTLVNPYPVALAGTLTLTFAPSGAVPVDDPNVQFATGGRTLAFNIPALSTATPTVQLQTGTVAGTVTVTLVVTANGTNVTPTNAGPVVITIPVAVPAISAASLVKAGATLSVVVQGYSNTRELTTAIFHFVAADGSTVSTPDITAPVTTVFANWFTSAASDQYGSAFTYTQNFTLNNDASTIGSVTVTLVNSVGNSTQQTAQ